MFVAFLHDEDGGERGSVEGETIADVLNQLNSLDGSDAMDAGCCYLGAYNIVGEDGREYEITLEKTCEYILK